MREQEAGQPAASQDGWAGAGPRCDPGGRGYAGASHAVATAQSALQFLAGADAGSLPDAELADCLKALERAAAAQTVARARILAAFHARGVCEDD